jgi:hypothetical protein
MGNPHKRKKLARLEALKAQQEKVAVEEAVPVVVEEVVVPPVTVEEEVAPVVAVEEPKPTKKKKTAVVKEE